MKAGIGFVVKLVLQKEHVNLIKFLLLFGNKTNRKMTRNVELVEVKQSRATKSSEDRPTENLQVHQSIVDSMCIPFTSSSVSLFFFKVETSFSVCGSRMQVSFIAEFKTFRICLTAGTRLLSLKNRQADLAVQFNINKPACSLKPETRLRR
jgi:hypothetical protein